MSDTNDRLAGYFAKHLVPIVLILEKGTDSREPVVTAFVLSVRDQWFLVTAGHWLKQIEQLIDGDGYEVTRCRFMDGLSLDAKHRMPIPVGWEQLRWEYIFDDVIDYGMAVLSPYYRELLEKNGIQAFSEEVWRDPPSEPDAYWLLGVPAELVHITTDWIRASPTLCAVEPLSERPKCFKETDAPLFYGRVQISAEVDSIKGMSGGPILAFKQMEDDTVRYWLLAPQSRWHPGSHEIAACPTRYLGEAIENAFQEGESRAGDKDGSYR